MSALLRALMGQQTDGDKPNLAIDTDITAAFDHLAGRASINVDGKTSMVKDGKYHVTCDVEITITENMTDIYGIRLGGYGPWHNGAALGTYLDIKTPGVYQKQIDYTGQFYSTNSNRWCQLSCGGLKGSVRLYNVIITEA